MVPGMKLTMDERALTIIEANRRLADRLVDQITALKIEKETLLMENENLRNEIKLLKEGMK